MKARTILPAAVVAVAVGVGAVLGATVPQVARTAHWLLESIAPSPAQEAARGRGGAAMGTRVAAMGGTPTARARRTPRRGARAASP